MVDSCDSSQFDYRDETLTPWFDREDAFEHIDDRLRKREISHAEAAALQQFVLDGYIVLPDLLDHHY